MEEYQKLCEENIKLVPFMIKKLNLNTMYDELVDVGYVGLIKGCKTYDPSKQGVSTYLCRCIRNEIFVYLRNAKKYGYAEQVSLESDFYSNYKFEDIVADPFNLEDYAIKSDSIEELKTNCKILSAKELDIINSIYGINCDKCSQVSLAKKYNCSQSNIQHIKTIAIKKLRDFYKTKGLLEDY